MHAWYPCLLKLHSEGSASTKFTNLEKILGKRFLLHLFKARPSTHRNSKLKIKMARGSQEVSHAGWLRSATGLVVVDAPANVLGKMAKLCVVLGHVS